MDYYGESANNSGECSEYSKNVGSPWSEDYSHQSMSNGRVSRYEYEDVVPHHGSIPPAYEHWVEADAGTSGPHSSRSIVSRIPTRPKQDSGCPYTRPSVSHNAVEQPRIGRPPKASSTSKMANYARNYRETKKNQFLVSEQRNQELTEENIQLKQHVAFLQESFSRVEREMANLRKVLDQDSQIASIVSNMSSRNASAGTSDVGVCLHLSGGKVVLEVCEQCSERVRAREAAGVSKKEDPFITGSVDDFSHYLC